MKERQILWGCVIPHIHIKKRHTAYFSRFFSGSMPGMLVLCLLLLAACGTTSNSNNIAAATPQEVRVNGFGTAANHPHAFLVFPNGVMVLATHYGTFWSNNNGSRWTEVAGGPGQIMDGLMSYSLTSSPLNPQRLYELTQPALSNHKGILGLYTSTDQGRSWKMTITEQSLVANEDVYLVEAGNETPDEVYVYLPALGADGLKVSKDAGEHFSATGTLPFGNMTALLALPGEPGQLLAASSSGMARSTDGGLHWQIIQSVSGGIFGGIVTAGPDQPIYASGDAGVYASTDGGKTFKLVNAGITYGSLTVSPINPQMLYGRTGTAVYYSANGGKTWQALPHIAGNLFGLVADPHNASQVYLSMSYPTEVYRFDQASRQWISLTPKA
jgi:hypothetical protein